MLLLPEQIFQSLLEWIVLQARSFTDNAVESLWNLTKPTIAMVDGFALGGGVK